MRIAPLQQYWSDIEEKLGNNRAEGPIVARSKRVVSGVGGGHGGDMMDDIGPETKTNKQAAKLLVVKIRR